MDNASFIASSLGVFLKLRLKRERKGNGSMVGGLKKHPPFLVVWCGKNGQIRDPYSGPVIPYEVRCVILDPFNPQPKTTTAEGSSEHMRRLPSGFHTCLICFMIIWWEAKGLWSDDIHDSATPILCAYVFSFWAGEHDFLELQMCVEFTFPSCILIFVCRVVGDDFHLFCCVGCCVGACNTSVCGSCSVDMTDMISETCWFPCVEKTGTVWIPWLT